MRKDEITIEADNGMWDDLYAVKVNGARIGAVRKIAKDKYISRGSFAGYTWDRIGETYYPTFSEAVDSLLTGFYVRWAKNLNLKVARPNPEAVPISGK
jgi:hypothetical protein